MCIAHIPLLNAAFAHLKRILPFFTIYGVWPIISSSAGPRRAAPRSTSRCIPRSLNFVKIRYGTMGSFWIKEGTSRFILDSHQAHRARTFWSGRARRFRPLLFVVSNSMGSDRRPPSTGRNAKPEKEKGNCSKRPIEIFPTWLQNEGYV